MVRLRSGTRASYSIQRPAGSALEGSTGRHTGYPAQTPPNTLWPVSGRGKPSAAIVRRRTSSIKERSIPANTIPLKARRKATPTNPPTQTQGCQGQARKSMPVPALALTRPLRTTFHHFLVLLASFQAMLRRLKVPHHQVSKHIRVCRERNIWPIRVNSCPFVIQVFLVAAKVALGPSWQKKVLVAVDGCSRSLRVFFGRVHPRRSPA